MSSEKGVVDATKKESRVPPNGPGDGPVYGYRGLPVGSREAGNPGVEVKSPRPKRTSRSPKIFDPSHVPGKPRPKKKKDAAISRVSRDEDDPMAVGPGVGNFRKRRWMRWM